MKNFPFIHDFRILRFDQVRVILQFVIAFPLEIVIKWKNIPRFDVLKIERYELEAFVDCLGLYWWFIRAKLWKGEIIIIVVEIICGLLSSHWWVFVCQKCIAVRPCVIAFDPKITHVSVRLLSWLMSSQHAIIDVAFKLAIVKLFLFLVRFLALVLLFTHSFQIEHLNHFVWNLLFLVDLVLGRFGEGFWHYCDGVSVKTTVQSALYYFAVLYWVLFENFVNIFSRRLHAQTL